LDKEIKITRKHRILYNMRRPRPTQGCTANDDEQYKGKVIPLQAWTDPECSKRLMLPDFKT